MSKKTPVSLEEPEKGQFLKPFIEESWKIESLYSFLPFYWNLPYGHGSLLSKKSIAPSISKLPSLGISLSYGDYKLKEQLMDCDWKEPPTKNLHPL